MVRYHKFHLKDSVSYDAVLKLNQWYWSFSTPKGDKVFNFNPSDLLEVDIVAQQFIEENG